MNQEEILNTINRLCQSGKGILAADESTGTIGKRFKQIDVINNNSNRIKYRDILFNALNLNEFISGVIIYEETLFDEKDGKRLVQPLLDNDIVIGIKTDCGLMDYSNGFDGEQITKGLDTLRERSKKYYEAGARFSKWRCVFDCDVKNNKPSGNLIRANAKILAQYAKISLECGLVPLVEPEVLMNENTSIEDSYKVTKIVLDEVYKALDTFEVRVDLTLLKPNMVRPGKNIDCLEVAYYTVKVLKEIVPYCIRGIFFLSGGMTEEEASKCLKLINSVELPWRVSFSYGRALQQSALMVWRGEDSNIEATQFTLLNKARINGLASIGC